MDLLARIREDMAHESNIWKSYLYRFLMEFQLWWPIWVVYLQVKRGLSLTQITLMDAPFFVLIVLAEVPTGAIADRFGRRFSLVLGSSLFAVAVFIFAIADSYPVLLLSYGTWGLALTFQRATRTLTRREAQLKVAIQQQDLAMQEIHHRVKNNLQIVASLLNLQASRIRLPEARAEFQSARDRVRALATVHRHLYAHGGLRTINMRTFLLELCGQLFHAMGETMNGRLQLEIDAPELEMSSDQAVPLSLIVTEAVTNAIKYAYPAGRRGTISVRLMPDSGGLTLEIKDDGVGIPAGKVETATGTRDGIGIQLINGFARQLGARLEVEQGIGTRYLVHMKLRRERLDSPALGT